MTTRYGASRVFGGTVYKVTGCLTRLDAEASVYRMMIRHGLRLPRLRQRWWQFWRATEYPEGYREGGGQ